MMILKKDSVNKIYNILNDYRNLITQLSQRVIAESGITFDTTYYNAYYNYDEAGNRIRKKVYKFIGTTSIPSQQDDPLGEDSLTDMPSHWQLVNDEIYSRGVDGKELCIYKNGDVEQWNVWGADNIGKLINTEDGLKPLFYMKDHLGSVRAIVDDKEDVLSAQDYDAWGHILQGRTYESDDSKFKFTSKERDSESGYDYFGARYYDSRVGRWGSVDPLSSNEPGKTPYHYTSNNPLNKIDPEGLDDFYYKNGEQIATDKNTGFWGSIENC